MGFSKQINCKLLAITDCATTRQLDAGSLGFFSLSCSAIAHWALATQLKLHGRKHRFSANPDLCCTVAAAVSMYGTISRMALYGTG